MTNRSEGELIAERVTDQVCVRGCLLRGAHFSACPDYGKDLAESDCRGCAPSPVHTGSVICSRCFGRMRALLRDAPDLIGRLRSLSDPMKAMLIEPVKISSRPVSAAAPVGSELLDAADTILANLRDWAHTLAQRSAGLPWHNRMTGLTSESAFMITSRYVEVIGGALGQATTDPDRALRLAEAIMVLHPEIDGERIAWSIADGLARWGTERRDRHVHPDTGAEEVVEEHAIPVREWYDPLLSIKDAAARHSLTARAVRKWTASGDLPIAARVRGPRGSVMLWVKASEVDRVAREMEARRSPGRTASDSDTPDRVLVRE